MSRPARNLSVISQAPISAVQARARVNRVLLSQIGSQFCAGEPELSVLKETWRVPILLITPGLVVGEVGESVVSAITSEIERRTPDEEIYAEAERLRKRHHAAIKTAFSRARSAILSAERLYW